MKRLTYTLAEDIVKPKRKFILRADTGGVVHWSRADMAISATASPWCSSGAQLVIFFGASQSYDYPTCLWCMLTPAKRCRS